MRVYLYVHKYNHRYMCVCVFVCVCLCMGQEVLECVSALSKALCVSPASERNVSERWGTVTHPLIRLTERPSVCVCVCVRL